MNKNKRIIMVINCASIMIASIISISADGKVDNYKISKDMEIYTTEGEEIVVYEMSIEEYEATDFRQK